MDKIAQRFFSVRELNTNYLSHKRTLWMEAPKPSFKCKSNLGRLERKKIQKHQNNAKGMGMRKK